MCQISVYVEDEGKEELILEDVTSLDIETTGVKLSTLFEGSKEVANSVLKSIDFMSGKVVLKKTA